MQPARKPVKRNEVRTSRANLQEPMSSHLFHSRFHLTFIVSRAGTRSVSTLSPAQYVQNFMIVSWCDALEQDPAYYLYSFIEFC